MLESLRDEMQKLVAEAKAYRGVAVTDTVEDGDELDLVDGGLFGPKHGLSADEEAAYASIAKLTEYDIEDVLCYHRGLFAGNARERVAELANVAPGGEER